MSTSVVYCQSCGRSLQSGSRFCNSCGAEIAHAQLVRENQVHEEAVVFKTRPSFIAVGYRYAVAGIVSLGVAALIGFLNLPFPLLVPVVLVAFFFPVLKHIQRNRVLYTLTTSKIEIEFGIISRTVRNIPLRNVQDVTIRAGLTERLLGIGDVLIDSASDAGKIIFRQIPNPRRQADLLLENLSRWR